jgi:hypothetical protein
VVVPTVDSDAVKESGNPAAQAEGVKQVSTGQGTATYQVGSGEYHFISQINPGNLGG